MTKTPSRFDVKFYVEMYYVSGVYKVLYAGEDFESAKSAYILHRDHPKMDTVRIYNGGKVAREYLGKNAIPRQ